MLRPFLFIKKLDQKIGLVFLWRKGWDKSPSQGDYDPLVRQVGPSIDGRTDGFKSITHISSKQKTPQRVFSILAERMGFEPMCLLPDNRISSAARCDHFDTFP